jgi:hypothetical protein
MVSAAQMAQMRADQDGALPDTCSVSRPTSGRNSIGEGTTIWTVQGTALPCRVRAAQLQPSRLPVGEQQAIVTSWVVSLEWDQSLLEGDRVTLSGGQVFEITDTTAEESWLTAKRGQATRIE